MLIVLFLSGPVQPSVGATAGCYCARCWLFYFYQGLSNQVSALLQDATVKHTRNTVIQQEEVKSTTVDEYYAYISEYYAIMSMIHQWILYINGYYTSVNIIHQSPLTIGGSGSAKRSTSWIRIRIQEVKKPRKWTSSWGEYRTGRIKVRILF